MHSNAHRPALRRTRPPQKIEQRGRSAWDCTAARHSPYAGRYSPDLGVLVGPESPVRIEYQLYMLFIAYPCCLRLEQIRRTWSR